MKFTDKYSNTKIDEMNEKLIATTYCKPEKKIYRKVEYSFIRLKKKLCIEDWAYFSEDSE